MFIRRPLPFQKNTVKMRSVGLFLHFTFFSFASSANIYNPSFQGGTGCEAGKLINTSSCLSTPNKARQATNGAGVLCYDSSLNCNSACSGLDCYPDYATCATGYAGGFISNVWICPEDSALFTLTSSPSALPNGAGDYCFLTKSDCETAIVSGQCQEDVTTCATGQAGPTQYNYISVIDQPSLPSGEPNGAGILCFDSVENCEQSNNNACGPNPAVRCSQDTEICTTGQAGPLPAATFTCSGTYPPGSLPNGGGQLCYDSYADCVYGPNACNDTVPCVLDPATCSTGVAGPTKNNYFCPQDMPVNGLPNGGGQLCYASTNDCVQGPNFCSDPSSCVVDTDTCGTGMVGPTAKNIFCRFDQPQTLSASPTTPGSLPNAAGGNCYFSQSSCLTGPNPCVGATECLADFTICSTGQAGPTAAWFFCQKDLAYGSLPDGGGELCYATPDACFDGPNPCGLSSPCALDLVVCSTGAAGPTANNWYCEADTPVGIQTGHPALPAASGMLCWDSVTDCVDGPNACTAAAGDCVSNNATTRICSTGLAGENPVGNMVACLQDVPRGAVANAAGKWCYDTPGSCANGTNACNAQVPFMQCAALPSAVCATADSAHPYYCPYDYPTSSGVSLAGNVCYSTAYACMTGANPCNTSFLCQVDAGLQGACRGALYPYYCSTAPASGGGGTGGLVPALIPHSAAGAGAPRGAEYLAAALAGAALLVA